MKIALLVLTAFIFSFHSGYSQTTSQDNLLYRSAINNSMYPTPDKVDSNLVVIDESNPKLVWKIIAGEKYVLAVSWKKDAAYYQKSLDTIYDTRNYPIWVTTAPELKERIAGEKFTDLNYRLVQLLGLPPNTVYNYFIEMWVKPQDLFRPCPDKEINDSRCETCFPAGTDSGHIAWINELRINSYYNCNLYSQYPWTELGYTYDWNPENTSHFGLSEFVVGKNKKVYIKAIYSTADYFNQ